MKVLLIQNRVCKEIKNSISLIQKQLDERPEFKPDFIVLPEMFTTPYELDLFDEYKQRIDGEVIVFLRNLAKRNSAYVIGGSIPFETDGALYNSSFVFGRDGEFLIRYDKIHLFEITYPNGNTFREAQVLSSGDQLGVFETEYGRMGIMICFDIRFPYLAEGLMEQDVQCIFVPAAFNSFTGPLHWKTTFESRAIDNQLFMIGCSPSGDSYGNYETYGHSIVVDPYGTVLCELNEESGIIMEEIDLNQIQEAREKLPIVKNRRKGELF